MCNPCILRKVRSLHRFIFIVFFVLYVGSVYHYPKWINGSKNSSTYNLQKIKLSHSLLLCIKSTNNPWLTMLLILMQVNHFTYFCTYQFWEIKINFFKYISSSSCHPKNSLSFHIRLLQSAVILLTLRHMGRL